MCCDSCCDRGGPMIDIDECKKLVKQTIENFDFERYSVRVVATRDDVDARLELWKQCLINDVINDVESATYES